MLNWLSVLHKSNIPTHRFFRASHWKMGSAKTHQCHHDMNYAVYIHYGSLNG